MKINYSLLALISGSFLFLSAGAQTGGTAATNEKKLYMDVHQLQPGKVKFNDVAAAHAKDLAVEKEFGVHFINYWVDEEKGLIYCLSSAGDSTAIRNTHAKAHGLQPAYTYEVIEGAEAVLAGNKQMYLDIHRLGAGNVTAAAVAEAHKKDLAVQDKNGVNFVNYWVDEKEGVVFCLSEAKSSEAVISTHKMAHGLLPVEVLKVKQGQ